MGTKLLWEAKRLETAPNGEAVWCVYSDTGMVVVKRTNEATAKKIALAVNAHEDLVEAVQEYKRMYEAVQPAGGWQGVYECGNYALAQAGK